MTPAEGEALLDKYPWVRKMSPAQAYRSLANTACFLPRDLLGAMAYRTGIKPTDKPPSIWWFVWDTFTEMFRSPL